jgi:ABC-type dipeptide/oligopeptide/nickel transport system permease component
MAHSLPVFALRRLFAAALLAVGALDLGDYLMIQGVVIVTAVFVVIVDIAPAAIDPRIR